MGRLIYEITLRFGQFYFEQPGCGGGELVAKDPNHPKWLVARLPSGTIRLCPNAAGGITSHYKSDRRKEDAAVEANAKMETKGDEATNIEFVDASRSFEEGCFINRIQFRVGRIQSHQPGLKFKVYRKAKHSDRMFEVVDETDDIQVATDEYKVQTVDLRTPLCVRQGDYFGWAHRGKGSIPFECRGGPVFWK